MKGMPYGTRGQVRRSRSLAAVFNLSDELRAWRHKHNLSQSEAGRPRAKRYSEDRPLSDCRTRDNAELRREASVSKRCLMLRSTRKIRFTVLAIREPRIAIHLREWKSYECNLRSWPLVD